MENDKIKIDGQEISEILTVNGIRFSFNDGSWGLIRASSNKPSLVIVTESPSSENRMKKIFNFIDDLLQKTGKIGEYDQKIWSVNSIITSLLILRESYTVLCEVVEGD